MTPLGTITTPVLDKMIAFLAPLFLDTMDASLATARHAAARMLASYDARTDQELRLAAEIIAFGFGALDALRRAANPDLSTKEVLRLRGNANSLNRAGQQNQRLLDRLHRRRTSDASAQAVGAELTGAEMAHAEAAQTRLAENAIAELCPQHPKAASLRAETSPDSSETDQPTIAGLLALAHAVATGEITKPALSGAPAFQPLSRQQRRAKERQADKQRRRQAEALRRLDRAGERTKPLAA